MYRVIMVPVDGSAFSREAVFQGLRLARKNGAQLRLVRVASIPGLVGGPDMVSLEQTARMSERDAMLAHLYRLWLGSVADRLIRETGLPVLIVRPPSLATELVDGACYKRIVVPLDGSLLAEHSLPSALALAELEHAELTLLRIVPSEKSIPSGELHAAIGPARAQDVDEAERYLAGVRVRLADHPVRIRAAVVVAEDVPRAILGFAQATDGDLIAIATHGRGGFARAVLGSVADRVMSDGVLSALVIHPAEQLQAAFVPEARTAGVAVLG